MYVLLLAAAFLFALGMAKRVRIWIMGKEEDRFNQLWIRLRSTLAEVFGHRRLLSYPSMGILHSGLFFGLSVLFAGTILVLLKADFGLDLIKGRIYLYFQCLSLDVAGGLVLFCLILIALLRLVGRPRRYDGMSMGLLSISFLIVIVLSGFFLEGLRISATNDPLGKWSPLGYLVGQIFQDMSVPFQRRLHLGIWWFHLLMVLVLLAALPFLKLRHLLLAPPNIFFRSLSPKGITVGPIDLENSEKLGAETLSDFSWKQLLDLDACMECGRCQEVCPVFSAGQDFSPRDVIHRLWEKSVGRSGIREDEYESVIKEPVVGAVLEDDTIWFCRTCRACMEACPVFVEHIPKFVEMRRFEVMEKASFPKTLHGPVNSIESRGHPYSGTTVSRTEWCEDPRIEIASPGEPFEILYWVGCTTALLESNWIIARSLVRLFRKAGIRVNILGNAERCCGEPARKIGNEYLFERVARDNIERLSAHHFDAIVTNCPHCYNTLKHEYQQFGGGFTVYHHTQYLHRLIREDRLRPGKIPTDKNLTYHDPCYLGRYNGVYDPPREMIRLLSPQRFMEMPFSRAASFCCGGGGGGAWANEEGVPRKKRINVVRAGQVRDSSADILVTACPFCMGMLKDGIRGDSQSNDPEIHDLGELLAGSMVTGQVP